jgi:hypothetical protein
MDRVLTASKWLLKEVEGMLGGRSFESLGVGSFFFSFDSAKDF